MNRKTAISIITFLCVLAFSVQIRSCLRQKDAVKTVRAVLTDWKNGNLILAMSYWTDETDSPPVYGLTGFEIGDLEINKTGGMYTALVTATLEFTPDNPMPSGKSWVFTLKKTRYGWKIFDFRLAAGG